MSVTWKHRFRLIEQAGGTKLHHFKSLAFGDRMKVMSNVLGFLFGPLYYVAKGMWRKALVMFSIGVLAIIVLSLVLSSFGLQDINRALGYGLAAVFSNRANNDYYKRVVLDENGW